MHIYVYRSLARTSLSTLAVVVDCHCGVREAIRIRAIERSLIALSTSKSATHRFHLARLMEVVCQDGSGAAAVVKVGLTPLHMCLPS